MAICYLAFVASERIAALLGFMGNIVLARLLGVILAALAEQIRHRRDRRDWEVRSESARYSRLRFF
jgi:hypothetical protein